jgi:hypothetical protein
MGSPNPPQNPYTYGANANNIYGNELSGNANLAGQGNQFTQAIINNPYAGGYQAAGNQAGADYGALAPLATGASSALYGAGNTALGAGNAILQAGFDPQKQLYSQVQNQNQQQNLAALAGLGVAGTPYGAGVAGQENTNFNLDWQNNQLQREATAANAYGGLNSTAQSDFAAGGAQGELGANAALLAGQLPWQTSNTINQSKLAALQGQQGLNSTAEQGAANYLQSDYNAAQQSWQDQEQQNQNMWGGIGSIFGDLLGGGGIGGLFGGGGGGGGFNSNGFLAGGGGLGSWLSSLFGGGQQIPIGGLNS